MATYELLRAYVRRKRWEQRELAVAIVNALGESMGSKGAGDRRQMPAHAVLGMIGATGP